ncbi:MAG TPA: ABC transporter ATP-binding protein [Acetobacteraceae bacterium]|nr:ABC transporter ATP-binding protein [Acetobacteraceae bacterium]
MIDRPTVLEIEGLCVELSINGRWIPALNEVNLTIRRGETLGLIGESGSGKSLTALSVPGLLPGNARVTGGSIRLLGEELLGKQEHELNKLRSRSVALVFQNPTTYLNPVLTIGQQIAEIFEVSPELLGPGRMSKRERRRIAQEKAVEYLRLVKIPDPERTVRQYPFELSGGMQQRTVIAMGLVRQPHLVIADEITTALDVTIQAQILGLLTELRRSIDMTLLLITHDMGIVAQLADSVAVMYSGSVIEYADVRSLFRAPKHPYAKALLEAVPTLQAGDTIFRPIPGGIPAITDPPPGCRYHPRCSRAFAPCSVTVPAPVPPEPGRVVACHLYQAAS